MTRIQGALGAALLSLACTASGHRSAPEMNEGSSAKASLPVTAKDYAGPQLPRGHVVLHDPYGGAHRVDVEIASDDDSRERGLMWRRSLVPGEGMLFVFPEAAEHSFWMKNTLIPLDMVFIGEDRRVVGVVANAEPGNLTPVGPQAPSVYVLEVPGGWATQLGIADGSPVEIEGTSMLPIK